MKKQGTGNREQGSAGREQRAESRDWRSFSRRVAGPALILLSAGLAISPGLARGVSCGHDFDFHLVSWLDALHSWRYGILYPHWIPSPNYGAGEPRLIFYPPLTWMLGAALGLFFPWHVVPGAFTFLLFAATGFGTRALARQAFSNGPATLAGCTAIFSGYALFTAYERSAFAEMTGGFWIPVMLLLILRDRRATQGGSGGRDQGSGISSSLFRRAFDGSAMLLALVVAGAWLSNAPLGVMLSYLLAAVAITFAVLSRSWAPIVRAATSALLGIGLAAFFLVPADWEQRWVDIRQAVNDPGLLIENSWLFARHADPRLELHDVELIRVSGIAVTMVAVAVIALLVSWKRGTLPANRRWWIPLALIPVVVLLLQLPVSDPVWNSLPKLRFLQFPWRWLVVLEAPMAIFFASAVWAVSRLWRAIVLVICVAAFAVATAIADVSFIQGCDSEDAVQGMLDTYRAGAGFEGTDEYAPPGADDSLVATGLPFACLVSDPTTTLGKGDPDMPPEWSADQGSCDATVPGPPDSRSTAAGHLDVHADTPHAGYFILRLRSYPAWKVSVNHHGVGSLPVREDGLMAIPVPRGPVNLDVDWTTTPDVWIGRWISALALLLVTGLGLVEYRAPRPRLS